ncbi:MAG TPA: TM2 domain-containing protein [Phycisphaerae bacterium]|nr:TM2 domain-containing protein [Phycisphaerae bacterium]
MSLGSWQPPPGYPPIPPPAPNPYSEAASKKLAAGLCAILIGTLGIHKFILGYTTAGLTMLLVSVLTCGLGAIVIHVIALIEGIMYLTKSDQEFYETYMVRRKEWF